MKIEIKLRSNIYVQFYNYLHIYFILHICKDMLIYLCIYKRKQTGTHFFMGDTQYPKN